MLGKLGKTGGAKPRAILSLIGADMRVVGDIFTTGEMQVDGRVEGDITCATLVIGEGAVLTGEITAQRVRIHGELRGRVTADTVAVARTGRVTGDITHTTLAIEAGAQLDGRLIHRENVPLPAIEIGAPATPAALAAPAPTGTGTANDETERELAAE